MTFSCFHIITTTINVVIVAFTFEWISYRKFHLVILRWYLLVRICIIIYKIVCVSKRNGGFVLGSTLNCDFQCGVRFTLHKLTNLHIFWYLNFKCLQETIRYCRLGHEPTTRYMLRAHVIVFTFILPIHWIWLFFFYSHILTSSPIKHESTFTNLYHTNKLKLLLLNCVYVYNVSLYCHHCNIYIFSEWSAQVQMYDFGQIICNHQRIP